MNRLYLCAPSKDNMWFKKELERDPKTMDYNAGYNVSFKGYNFNDGTIEEDLGQLQNVWLPKWKGCEPNKYFAFIRKVENDEYIGEVYFKDKSELGHEIGIVIKGEHRGNGYAKEAIKLLCEKADEMGVEQLFHQLPDTRRAAIKADLDNGFVLIKENIPCPFTKFGERENEVLLIRKRNK